MLRKALAFPICNPNPTGFVVSQPDQKTFPRSIGFIDVRRAVIVECQGNTRPLQAWADCCNHPVKEAANIDMLLSVPCKPPQSTFGEHAKGQREALREAPSIPFPVQQGCHCPD